MRRCVVGVVLILSCAVAGLARGDPEFRQDRERLSRAFELFSDANELTQPPEGQSALTPPQETSKRSSCSRSGLAYPAFHSAGSSPSSCPGPLPNKAYLDSSLNCSESD